MTPEQLSATEDRVLLIAFRVMAELGTRMICGCSARPSRASVKTAPPTPRRTPAPAARLSRPPSSGR